MVIKIRDNGVLKTYQVATSSDLFQKLDTPDTTGTSGQILGLNSNLETEWVDKPTVPTVISALTNDAGFITNTVSNLANYYTTANTYSKTEVNNLISQIPKMDIEVVSSLPTTDISTTTIYLLSGGAETGNLYEEYLYVNDAWEKLGAQSITIPTPDWDATSGQAGYIANRTHYRTLGEIALVSNIEFPVSGYNTLNGANMVSNAPFVLVDGDTYKITIDGVDYEDTVYTSTNAKYPALGNVNSFDGTPVRDFPFGIVQVYNNDDYAVWQVYGNGKSQTGTIYGNGYTYTKLDNEYLNGKLITSGTGKNSEIFNSSNNIASGFYSHAEGYLTSVISDEGHAEGYSTQSKGVAGHAEGSGTIAYAAAHAEGTGTKATGGSSHAECMNTTASGSGSHAEGCNTTASSLYSHAEGSYTIAASTNQHVQGKYNVQDKTGTYAHIVGGGTSDSARSNIHTLDWSGNGVYAGKLTVGAAPTADMDVATKKYVDDNAGGADWEASSGESGYVANRTHYKEEGLEEVLKTSFYNSGYYRGYHEVQTNISPLVVGDEYTIEINGVQYTDTVYQSTGAKFPALGNVNRFDNTPVRDFPFGIVQVYNSGNYIVLQCYATGNTVLNGTIYKSGYSYTKLNNKYLDGKLIIQGTGGEFSEVFNSDTNIADGAYSHAEGYGTKAMGPYSHAAGCQTKANDWNSTAIGYGVIANRKSQFAFGEYNIPDVTGGSGARGQYIEVVGNGDYHTESNARTLDWSGNMWCAGTVSAGTTASPAAVTNDNDLTTKAYVDGLVGDIETLLAGI